MQRKACRWPPDLPRRFVNLLLISQLIGSINQSISQSMVQVIKSLRDPLEVGNNLLGINDNVSERGVEQKCFKR